MPSFALRIAAIERPPYPSSNLREALLDHVQLCHRGAGRPFPSDSPQKAPSEQADGWANVASRGFLPP